MALLLWSPHPYFLDAFCDCLGSITTHLLDFRIVLIPVAGELFPQISVTLIHTTRGTRSSYMFTVYVSWGWTLFGLPLTRKWGYFRPYAVRTES